MLLATVGSASAQIFGLLGAALLAVFIVGGAKDNDGEGTNMT